MHHSFNTRLALTLPELPLLTLTLIRYTPGTTGDPLLLRPSQVNLPAW